MTEQEAKELLEVVDQLKSINSKLDKIIQHTDSSQMSQSQELKTRGIVNGLLLNIYFQIAYICC